MSTGEGEKVEELCRLLDGQLSGPQGLLVAEFTWFRLEFDANKAVYIVELGFGEEEVADRTVGAESLDSVMDLALQAAKESNPRFKDKKEQEKREQMSDVKLQCVRTGPTDLAGWTRLWCDEQGCHLPQYEYADCNRCTHQPHCSSLHDHKGAEQFEVFEEKRERANYGPSPLPAVLKTMKQVEVIKGLRDGEGIV